MVYIQLNLTDDEKETVDLVKIMQKKKTKQEAIKYIIQNYKDQNK